MNELIKQIIKDNLKPRSVITYINFFVLAFLLCKQLPIPDFLKDLIMVMQGFWFGSKAAQIQKGNGGQ